VTSASAITFLAVADGQGDMNNDQWETTQNNDITAINSVCNTF